MRKITTRMGVELLVPEKGEKHPNAGRPKGAKNVMTRKLKEAMIVAAGESHHAKKYGDGLVGYLAHLADERPDLFVPLQTIGTLRLPEQRTGDRFRRDCETVLEFSTKLETDPSSGPRLRVHPLRLISLHQDFAFDADCEVVPRSVPL